ncbi:MAG TPA: tetratricopeptide repeat protein [Allosphingosinicella sp.]|uniref:tetratricopeptide repeat protein n=1 Tax=Allosphingosinicella sp. TaxID=2823234 RepID=UPI002F2746A7
MRNQALLLILLASVAAPAVAQTDRAAERRLEKIEAELRAVQRKVFPGGRQATVEPEIGPPAASAGPAPGVPAGSAVADMTARIDALEAQLARLTGQAEENGNQLRQLSDSMNRFKLDTEARLTAAERPAATPEQRPQLASEQLPVPDAAVLTSNGDADPEQAYLAGFKLWEQKRYSDAQATLDAMAKRHPTHPKASWARNLAGRALLDDGKPAAAAKILFANYEADPKGERAADSLFYLGQALTRLKKNTEACQVYTELQDVFGAGLRETIRKDLPAARKAAGCRA